MTTRRSESYSNFLKGTDAGVPFKDKKSFTERRAEASLIKEKFPCKVPVVVEKYQKERHLPILDKAKFLVPEELSLSQLQAIIRSRLHLESNQAFYLIVGRKTLPCMSLTVAEIYSDNQDPDGFLYMTYASQEIFGGTPDNSCQGGLASSTSAMLCNLLERWWPQDDHF